MHINHPSNQQRRFSVAARQHAASEAPSGSPVTSVVACQVGAGLVRFTVHGSSFLVRHSHSVRYAARARWLIVGALLRPDCPAARPIPGGSLSGAPDSLRRSLAPAMRGWAPTPRRAQMKTRKPVFKCAHSLTPRSLVNVYQEYWLVIFYAFLETSVLRSLSLIALAPIEVFLFTIYTYSLN